MKTRKIIIAQFLLATLLTIISAASVFSEAFEGNCPSVWAYRFSGADSSLNATKDHPFWSEDRRAYVPIGELLPGEKVKTRLGTAEFVSKVKTPGSQKVYNLEVFREHNYFVTKEGLLAHNCGSGVLSETYGISEDFMAKSTFLPKSGNKQVGGYFLEYESGNFYAGKGTIDRMNKSALRIAKKNEDVLLQKTFFPAPNTTNAFILEHQLMINAGGPLRWFPTSPTYNIIYSPGKLLLEGIK